MTHSCQERKERRIMEQYREPESQALDDDDLQNVVGGLSQNAKDGLIAGGVSVGGIVGGGILWHHLEQKYNKSHFGTGDLTRVAEIAHR
jgi:hypothetical protein